MLDVRVFHVCASYYAFLDYQWDFMHCVYIRADDEWLLKNNDYTPVILMYTLRTIYKPGSSRVVRRMDAVQVKARIKAEIVLCKRACGGPEFQLVQFMYVISHCKNKPCFHISLVYRAAGEGKKSDPCSLSGGGVN
jgi:hypothetical protein